MQIYLPYRLSPPLQFPEKHGKISLTNKLKSSANPQNLTLNLKTIFCLILRQMLSAIDSFARPAGRVPEKRKKSILLSFSSLRFFHPVRGRCPCMSCLVLPLFFNNLSERVLMELLCPSPLKFADPHGYHNL